MDLRRILLISPCRDDFHRLAPNDVLEDISTGVGEYLAAGVWLVWGTDPVLQRGPVYRGDGSRPFMASTESGPRTAAETAI
jgi:hypothetical protein